MKLKMTVNGCITCVGV